MIRKREKKKERFGGRGAESGGEQRRCVGKRRMGDVDRDA